MRHFIVVFIVLFASSAISIKADDNSPNAYTLNQTIYKAPQQAEFCEAIMGLRNSGLTVNVAVPFLRNPSSIQTNGVKSTAWSYLEIIKKATGYNYKLEGTSVTFFDPTVMSERYDPLNVKVTIQGSNVRYHKIISEIEKQTGYLVVDLSSFDPPLTIKLHNGTLRDLLDSISSQWKSNGWWCGIDQRNGKTLIRFSF